MKLEKIVTDTMLELQAALRKELEAQGHTLSGKLSQSISFEVSSDGSEAVGRMYFEDYGVFVEVGVTADRIPYGKGGSKGGTSKYIQGLVSFWEQRGLSGREALSAAFATARVHAREGMPSRGSYAHTSTGERTGFVRTAIEGQLENIGKTISDRYGASLLLQFGEALSNHPSIRLQA